MEPNSSRYHKLALSSALSSEAYRRARIEGYAIGTHLRDGALRVLRLVVRANSRVDKLPVLLRLREELEELKVLLRLCHDAKAFANFNSFERSIVLVTEIAKQNEGWLKSQHKGRGQNRRVILEEIAEPSVPPSIRVLRPLLGMIGASRNAKTVSCVPSPLLG